MSKAFGTMVIGMVMDNKVMSTSGNAVYKKKLPIAGEVGRRFSSKISLARVAPGARARRHAARA
jgi:hypothetical protein